MTTATRWGVVQVNWEGGEGLDVGDREGKGWVGWSNWTDITNRNKEEGVQ